MKRQTGQALVIVLLSLAVVLTLILFVLARSTTDVAVSSRNEEAIRAFSAAEAGVENALVIGAVGNVPQIGGAQYSANVSNFAEGSGDINYPVEMSSGDSTTIWFVAHDADGNFICNDATKPCFKGSQITVCWGKPGTEGSSQNTPAIEAGVFYEATPGSPGTIRIARGAYDPFAGRSPANNFSSADAGGCTILGTSYAFKKTISFSGLGIPAGSYNAPSGGGLKFVRLRMFYNVDQTQSIGVTNSGCPECRAFPSQGLDVVSTGTAGEANRRVQVFQGWPEPPSVFDYALYSSTGLTK